MQNPDNKRPSERPANAPSAKSAPFPKASAGAFVPSPKQAVDGDHDAVDSSARAGDELVKRLVEGAHAAIDNLADVAGPTVDRIADALSNPSGKASSLVGQASDQSGAWVSDVRDIVREHPIAAIAVALAAGAVFVKLTATPSHDPRDGLDD